MAAFLALTLLFISLSAKAEYEVNVGNSTEYLTSLDSNFQDTFQAIQPKLRVINPGQFQLQLFHSADLLLSTEKSELPYPKGIFHPQVFGVQIHLLTILKFVICTNAP